MPVAGQGAVVLVLGDSISSGYGLANPTQGWVGLLADKIKIAKKPWTVVNESISGETSAGGVNRVSQLLNQHRPGILILELGANDGLRGLNPKLMHNNLAEIANRAKASGTRCILLGMRIPPNYGKRYTDLFEAVFPQLSQELGLDYVPFLLAGVAGNAQYMQADGLHPNESAQVEMLRSVWGVLEPVL